MTNSLVSISKCDNYNPDNIRSSLEQTLSPLGGIEAFVKPGQTVLLKINLLRGSAPDKAVTTHPALIEAVIDIIRSIGAKPIVGDSPGGPNTPKMIKNILEATEIGALCERTDTELIIFDHDVTTIKSPAGKLYTSFSAGKIVRDADVVISLPKLKTHGFMKFTGAVKVLFGVIPGMEKMQYHLKVPGRMDFADMLIDLYLAVNPSLSIMDAVVGMEGEGPSGGNPKQIGALIASADSIALDFVASRIIGFEPLDVYTNRAAFDRGLICGLDDITISGIPINDLLVADFVPPIKDFADKTPSFFFETMKSLTTAKPFLAEPHLCTGCGMCKTSCPAKAISYRDKKPQFDYKTCIRCYCCEELCQELAIKRKNHWLVKPFLKKH